MSRARDLADAGSKANFLDNVTADINTTYAPKASPTFSGTVSGVDAGHITTGTLGNTVQDNITRLGTVTTGTIGSGVTLNISTRTLTSEVSLSGSATPVLTNDVPSNAKEIKILVDGVSNSSGTPDIIIQLGTGSSSTPSFKTTGYVCVGGYLGTASALEASTNGFILKNNINASTASHNSICLTYYGGNKWFFAEQGHYDGTTTDYMSFGQGYVSLSAQLTQIRITNETSVNFDAGNAVVMFCV